MGLTDVLGLQIPMPAPDLTFDLPTTSPSRYPVALCIKPRRLLVFVFVCPAAISKLEEALWINNRKYDAPWCWEMLKLFAHYALRTKMRQGFQKMLQCFLKALNEFVQRRVSHYKEFDPTEHLLPLKAFCELQAQVNP